VLLYLRPPNYDAAMAPPRKQRPQRTTPTPAADDAARSAPAGTARSRTSRDESHPTHRGQASVLDAAPTRWQRADTAWVVAIVLFALTLRLIYVGQLRSSPDFDHPAMDALYHDQWAQAIATGERFVEGAYFRAPLYPAFLGLIYTVCGHDYLAPRLAQAVLGALSCGLLYLVGRLVFARWVAGVAGLAAGSYWILIYLDGELLIPPLIVFLDLLLILCLLQAYRRPAAWLFALAGVLLGLSAIARPNILLFGPGIVAWLLWLHRRQLARGLFYSAITTAGCLLVVLPITVRNWIVGRDLVLIASQGGVNFYIGNNPESDGCTAVVPGTPGDWWGGYYATIARAEQAAGRKLKPSEVSDYYYNEAFKFIREQPARFVGLMLLKVRLFWSWWEFSNNKGVYFWTEQFTPIMKFLPLGFGVVGPLGLLGLALCWRRRAELFPLWGFILIYMVSIVIFFCTERYRVPVLPLLILLAVFAVGTLVRTLRERRHRLLGVRLAVLAAATLLVYTTPRRLTQRNDPGDYAALGHAYELRGDIELAMQSYQQAVRLRPGYLTAHYNLGTLLGRSGRPAEAIAELRRALAARPVLAAGETVERIVLAHTNLATALAQTGDLGEAIEHYHAAINLEPRAAGDALANLSALLVQTRRYAEALELLHQPVISSMPGVLNRLVFVLATVPDDSLRDGPRALAYARQLCPKPEVCPPAFLDTLAAALAETGQHAEAARWARTALERIRRMPPSPDTPPAAQLEQRLHAYESGAAWRLPPP